ncbi:MULTISPECIES: ABC transporter permease [Bacillaceae]|uniref:ABC transporter permease n=1 Tax=Bacillaceae TaxID=186817 RepID=UPI001E57C5E8|nr:MULTISPECIES: ABC transporter permease [Bacillaceae]MCE4050115.1 ABC transporter permease [Bacillus sp. Au-Bac7]MCM3031553.1 ABC transporter permease [Niallia sp. MER 6]MDL0435520.1 ABC transporter permease [Niallia sp. SS-2023]UPO88160.1 ABC transporter permease [Niallia sp. Man26]
MYKYIIRRVLVFIPMLFALTVIVFGLMQAAPGDPFTGKLDPNVDPEVYEQQKEALGLNDPIYVQYFRWLGNMLQGDFGESIVYKGREVTDLLESRVSNTLTLGTFSLFITILFSIPIGIYSARKPYSILDYTVTTFSFFGLAIPSFFFGLVAIYFFAIQLGWFPSQGTVSSPNLQGAELFWDKIHHLILPGLTLGLGGMATYTRYMRSEVLDVLSGDYIRTARAKGMTENTVLYKHTLRNALIPIVTLLGFEIGAILGGAIITEGVYQYPGLGTLFINSISSKDYPVIMVIALMIGFFTLLGNLLADIGYSLVDPRIRYE